MAHQVFICHSSTDKAVADAACAALEAHRIPCWIAPRDVLGGTEYMEELDTALFDSRIVLLIFSQKANDSPQVRREIERAVSYEKIILPFRIENILPTRALKFALSNTHWLDALTPPVEQRLTDLCNTVTRLLERAPRSVPLWQTPSATESGPVPEPLQIDDTEQDRLAKEQAENKRRADEAARELEERTRREETERQSREAESYRRQQEAVRLAREEEERKARKEREAEVLRRREAEDRSVREKGPDKKHEAQIERGDGFKSAVSPRNAIAASAALLAIIGITWMLVAHFHRHSIAAANGTSTQQSSPPGANPKAPPLPVVSHSPQFEAEEKAGLDAETNARFDQAQAHFENAVAMEPNNPQALLYAAAAAAINVLPGVDSPDNIKQNQHATDLVNRVLELQPSDGFALQILEVLYRYGKEYDRSNDVLEQILKIDPTNATAHYTIAVNDWSVAYRTMESGLEAVGLHDDGVGYPKASLIVCLAIAARTGPLVADAIKHLDQTVALNPNDDDAMAYLNLVYRLRAGTACGDDAARKADIATADSYVEKTKQTRIAKESAREKYFAQHGVYETDSPAPLPSNLTLPNIFTSSILPPPQPPPPPPPPPPPVKSR